MRETHMRIDCGAGFQPAGCPGIFARFPAARCRPNQQAGSLPHNLAFSLIEIMLAVALMTIIMLGLLAMFYQTQRAMRLGTAQVDAMGTGDAAMQLLMRELKEVASGGALSPSLQTRTPYPMLAWPRDFATQPQLTLLQELFFVR